VPDVTITRRGADRLRTGHPWIYRSDISSADAVPGDIVRVWSDRRRPVGWALWSERSQISLRLIDRGFADTFDEARWLMARLTQAVAYRETLGIDGDAMRLVHGEADGLPALVVDRYGDYLVIQALCQGMDRRQAAIVAALVERIAPRGVLARNDPRVRQLEGLDQVVEVLHGEVPDSVEVRDGAIGRVVDLRGGQKTGLFLDQRENYEAAARYGHGRALDAFCYQGGFALHLAGVCETVLAIDSSAPALAGLEAAAARNGIANVETREANVFDELRELETGDDRFGTIVLDPPAFAKNKASIDRAGTAYKEINLRAIKLLEPGGHLITCSCSYNVSEAHFEAIVAQAAADARAQMVLVEKRAQARDHPILIGAPETHYLKALVLRKLA
jgi:23S rRNA (cytosine1962-C5)-methyltransferase